MFHYYKILDRICEYLASKIMGIRKPYDKKILNTEEQFDNFLDEHWIDPIIEYGFSMSLATFFCLALHLGTIGTFIDLDHFFPTTCGRILLAFSYFFLYKLNLEMYFSYLDLMCWDFFLGHPFKIHSVELVHSNILKGVNFLEDKPSFKLVDVVNSVKKSYTMEDCFHSRGIYSVEVFKKSF